MMILIGGSWCLMIWIFFKLDIFGSWMFSNIILVVKGEFWLVKV